jgi:sigma-B regulation protein RsbU (phosphoserine phosphatase)
VALTGAGVALIGIGLMLLLMRGLIRRIRGLSVATERVAQGDFTSKLAVRENRQDELDHLGSAFNRMSVEIQALLERTAQAARMERELETAQLVQKRFAPEPDWEDPRVSLAGRIWSASECAGDWWHHRVIGDRLIVAIGDVTGHGVSSALITAAAHAGFHGALSRLREEDSLEQWVSDILELTNHAVVVSAQKEAAMSFLLSICDLRTGELAYGNAGHHPVYMIPQGGKLKPLLSKQGPQLGTEARLGIEVARAQLQPGDRLLWYTDGLVEGFDAEGQPVNKSRLQRAMKATQEATFDSASKWLSDVIQKTVGCGPEDMLKLERPDDITVIAIQLRAALGRKQAA